MDGKIAVVSGVSRRAGIGHAIVKAFLREGYSVIGLDVRFEGGQIVKECECVQSHSVVHLLSMDRF